MKLSFTKEEHEEFIKNHFQIKTAHVIDEENEMYYIIPVKEDYTKHDRVIAKTQAEKFGFVFGDGLMVLDYKPIKPTCANYERDNVETETYTITADKYFHQEFKKLVNIDAPILSEMEQNIADYLTTVFPYEKQENIINGLLKHYDYIEVYPVFQRLHYKGKNRIINSECQDPVVESVRQKLLDRSNVGIKKYNTTLDSNNTDNYLKHAQEEAMDLSNYLEKLMQQKEDITQIVASETNDWELGKLIRKIYGK
jgi:hypothetical protein